MMYDTNIGDLPFNTVATELGNDPDRAGMTDVIPVGHS